jgi:hypothetical protein
MTSVPPPLGPGSHAHPGSGRPDGVQTIKPPVEPPLVVSLHSVQYLRNYTDDGEWPSAILAPHDALDVHIDTPSTVYGSVILDATAFGLSHLSRPDASASRATPTVASALQRLLQQSAVIDLLITNLRPFQQRTHLCESNTARRLGIRRRWPLD